MQAYFFFVILREIFRCLTLVLFASVLHSLLLWTSSHQVLAAIISLPRFVCFFPLAFSTNCLFSYCSPLLFFFRTVFNSLFSLLGGGCFTTQATYLRLWHLGHLFLFLPLTAGILRLFNNIHRVARLSWDLSLLNFGNCLYTWQLIKGPIYITWHLSKYLYLFRFISFPSPYSFCNLC